MPFAGIENLMYFDNIPMYNLCISQSRPDYETMYSFDGFSHKAEYIIPSRSYDEVNLSFSIRASEGYDYKIRLLQRINSRTNSCYSEFGILGKGWICQNCGEFSPSGTIECDRCGGHAKEDFVRPMQFPFRCSGIHTETLPYYDELYKINVDFVGYGKKCLETIESLFNCQNIFYANGYSLESSYYLCQYCGQAVRDGDECPGCGGERRAYSDLVKLERKCVYCGRQVFGGIVCQGCGARIKGLTFKKAFVNR